MSKGVGGHNDRSYAQNQAKAITKTQEFWFANKEEMGKVLLVGRLILKNE